MFCESIDFIYAVRKPGCFKIHQYWPLKGHSFAILPH
jgi:hypothetical protein